MIWLGDFNYRIGMSSERVKSLIKASDLAQLYENDQLNIQMVAGLTFPHYSEARITFMPTYKFDVGTDTYDTSEKARIPAWTDRILHKGTNVRQTAYGAAPLTFSDHRPVFATFECTVNIVDEELRETLSRRIFEKRRAEVGGTVANTRTDESEDEDLIGYEPIEPGLPPASSDRRRWWLENGQPARSRIAPPRPGLLPNPARPSNPWEPMSEPEWVAAEKLPRAAGMYPGGAYGQGKASLSTPSLDTTPASPTRGRVAGATRKKLPPPYIPPPPASQTAAGSPPVITRSPPSSSTRATSPSPSRSVASSTTARRNPPPAVARKPVHLTTAPAAGSATAAAPQGRDHMAGVTTRFPPPPGRADAMAALPPGRGSVTTQFPPPPRRATAHVEPPVVPGPRRGGRAAEEGGGEGKPKMPPRPSVPVVDLLGDSEDAGGGGAGLEGWGVLRPGAG